MHGAVEMIDGHDLEWLVAQFTLLLFAGMKQ